MSSKRAVFGDERLSNAAIDPVAPEKRSLDGLPLVACFAAVGVSHAAYAFSQVPLPFGYTLLALAAGLAISAVLQYLLAQSSRRYAIGFGPLSRATFGPRGAVPVVLLRFAVGIVWMVMWAYQTGFWIASLARKALQLPSTVIRSGPLNGFPIDGWVVTIVLLVVGYRVASRGLVATAKIAAIAMSVAAIALVALTLLAGNVSRGFGRWFLRQGTWDSIELITAVVLANAVTLPFVLSLTDVWRFVAPAPDSDEQPSRRLQPWAMVPAGLLMAVCGALWASAAHVFVGNVEFSPIGDAAAFGGYLGASFATAFACSIWLVAAPLLGFHTSALAVATASPRVIDYRFGLALTCIVAVLFIPVWYLMTLNFNSPMLLVFGFCASPLGVMLADEFVWRRGRLELLDVYGYRGLYRGLFGVRVSALAALLVGFAVHPLVWSKLPVPKLLEGWLTLPHREAVFMMLSALIAAFTYLLVAPITYAIAALWRKLVYVVKVARARRQVAKAKAKGEVQRRRHMAREPTPAWMVKDGKPKQRLLKRLWRRADDDKTEA